MFSNDRHYTGIGMYQEEYYSTFESNTACPWCSTNGITVWHSGTCPLIKEIEYHPNGTIKKVSFK